MTRIEYSPEIVEKVCELLESGMTMFEIGKLPDMPNRSTIYKWCRKDEATATLIARARELGWDQRAEQAVYEARNATDPAKARLSFDADRWLLSKMSPERYGEKQHLKQEISGPNGAPMQLHAIVDEGEAAQRLHAILQNVEARRQALLTDQREHNAEDLA